MSFHYATRLHEAVRAKGTSALVGIDPRFDWLPASIIEAARQQGGRDEVVAARAFEAFSCKIIEVVAPLVPAVKPQAAFFEALGPAGCAALERVISAARRAGLIVICDAKRGDIGSTAEAYAAAYLAGADPAAALWQADALTVNPYLGADTLEPFVQRAEKVGGGIYVLVRTSNPGARAFQDVANQEGRVFEHVARVVEGLADRTADPAGWGCVGAVVGATYPLELRDLRIAMPHVPLLIPGYGSQGGKASDVAAAYGKDRLGALVNNSRGINFAYRQSPYREEFGESRWEDAVEAATRAMIADLESI